MPAPKNNRYAAKPEAQKLTARCTFALTEAQLEAYKVAWCEQEAKNFSAWIRDALDGQALFGKARYREFEDAEDGRTEVRGSAESFVETKEMTYEK